MREARRRLRLDRVGDAEHPLPWTRFHCEQSVEAIPLFMRIHAFIGSIIATLCLIGCSKQGGSKRLVPKTAAEVMASADYKLEHTTKGGIQCYVRPLTAEIAKTVSEDSPDHEFLYGDDGPNYFLVLIRDGKIIEGEAAAAGALTMADGIEVTGFVMGRDPTMKQMLKEAGEKP